LRNIDLGDILALVGEDLLPFVDEGSA
jgi:hypothetical protein